MKEDEVSTSFFLLSFISYPFPNALDLLNPDSISRFEGYLAAALDASGYQGEVSLISFPFSGGYTFHIVITSSDAPDLALNFQFCGLQYDFVQEDCCEKNAPPPPAGVAAGLLPHNDDLFYEEITYNGLDISRIEIGSDCSLGYMRNDFSYDTNHRVTRMLNTFFNPGPIAGRYNTSYQYDAAGNITRLNRYGLIDASAGQYTYGLIDSLVYTYANGDSRLSAIEDFVPDPLAEQKGFEIAGAFGYDGNGNFTSDGDQGLAIVSNLINLPRIVASPSDSLLFEYTFGGEKIRKLQTSPVARERIYLGGAEFVNDTLELYHHAEGRVVWRDTTPAFQYRIADHLGNTVVFFEDRDGDTYIKTESMTSDPDSLEVLQRNYYYPFGMEMEGPWQAATAPRADYLYNGKELEEDLGLKWYDYGARYYDPSIARFTSIDRFAVKYSFQSPYVYAVNIPIKFIDINGDSIGVNIKNPSSQKAFDTFFETKQGKAFIGQYAAKGQTINGFTFEQDGKYHKEGIDLVYYDSDFGNGKESTGAVTSGGTKGGTFVNNRLKLGVNINTTAEESSLIEKVIDITHESFLHVQEYSFDYTDNGKLDFSNDPFYATTQNNSPSRRHHLLFHQKPGASTTHPLATYGLSLLEEVNNKKRLGYSRTQLWNKLWNFWD